MEKSGSQKALKVMSILDIIGGVFMLIMAILGFVGSAGVASISSTELSGSGLSANDQTAGVALFGLLGVVLLVSGILELVVGILGIRASNDPSKIMPVWVIAAVSLICSACTLVAGIFHLGGMSFDFSSVVSLALNGLMFWIANNIKNQNTEA